MSAITEITIHSTAGSFDPIAENSRELSQKIASLKLAVYSGQPTVLTARVLNHLATDPNALQVNLNSFRLNCMAGKGQLLEAIHRLGKEQDAIKRSINLQVNELEGRLRSKLGALIQKAIADKRKDEEEKQYYFRHWYI